jgi:hypothetical protein
MLGAAPAAPSNNSKALIHALECMQNRIKQMEQERAGLEQNFAEYRTRAAGQLSELQLAHADAHECAKDHAEQNRASEQSTAEAWERTGVLNAALMRANGQVETLQVQLGKRDNELTQMRDQLERASNAVSIAGSRASEYSGRVTEMVGEVSVLRSELQRARADAESSRERLGVAERAMHQLQKAKEEAQSAHTSELARAERMALTLRSLMKLSEHVATRISHGKMTGAVDSSAYSEEETAPHVRIQGLPGYCLDIKAFIDPKQTKAMCHSNVRCGNPSGGCLKVAKSTATQALGPVWVPAGPTYAKGHTLSSLHANTRRTSELCSRSSQLSTRAKTGRRVKNRAKSATARRQPAHRDDIAMVVDNFLEQAIMTPLCTDKTIDDPLQVGLGLLQSDLMELNR